MISSIKYSLFYLTQILTAQIVEDLLPIKDGYIYFPYYNVNTHVEWFRQKMPIHENGFQSQLEVRNPIYDVFVDVQTFLLHFPIPSEARIDIYQPVEANFCKTDLNRDIEESSIETVIGQGFCCGLFCPHDTEYTQYWTTDLNHAAYLIQKYEPSIVDSQLVDYSK